MRFTIKRENLDPEKTLCGKCRSGHVYGDGVKTFRYCQAMERHLTVAVTECSAFKEEGDLSIFDMREIAWILEVNKRSRKVGFAPPKDHGRKPRAHLTDDGDIFHGLEDDD